MSAVPDVFTCPLSAHEGFHCEHWSWSAEPCCYCGTVEDCDDARCRLTAPETGV